MSVGVWYLSLSGVGFDGFSFSVSNGSIKLSTFTENMLCWHSTI